MSSEALGEFEHLVLLAILRAGERADGTAIRGILRERADKEASFGAIYSTLRRLEATHARLKGMTEGLALPL